MDAMTDDGFDFVFEFSLLHLWWWALVVGAVFVGFYVGGEK